jgi:hypothetical protein
MPYKDKNKNKERNRIYYSKNKDKVSLRQKEYYKKNKTKIDIRNKIWQLANPQIWKPYLKEYEAKHRKHRQELRTIYTRERMKEDKLFKLGYLLRRRIWGVLNNKLDGGKIKPNILYGIDINDIAQKLIKELPQDFEFGKYHADHIIPIACFDLNDAEQLKECFKPSNYQWLLAQDNLNKADKILPEHKPLYLELKNRFNLK